MDNILENKFYKTVIINRAVSGSGKTTLSRCVTNALIAHGLTVSAYSTDDFFMKDGRYVFEITKLNEYHAKNLANFEKALERGDDVVICDNMNLLPWQSQPYTNAARKYNYRIIFLNFLPRELEKHLAAQVVTAEKPDAHGLSKELLMRFIENFNDYNDLLDKNTVRDINRHKRFVWNFAENKPMDTGELALYFDSDYVITIRPEQYQEFKQTLADSVLKIITESDEQLKNRDIQKHYLLTWYGITDIRAALGLEPTDGPVLGALRTGKYTDAIILGYTNLNKSNETFSGALRDEWEKFHALPLEERMAYPRAKGLVFVDAICNTANAHELFQKYLAMAKLPVRIHFNAQTLSHLNDARAIDTAARSALRMALSDKKEKDITCFLSPGTPVMAYTWAMVSKTNPDLSLHVIASSDPRKPPEEIILPKDVMNTPIISTNGTNLPQNFDAIIHLLGTDTNIPQFFSIVQFPASRHYFITSSDSGKAKPLKRLLPNNAIFEIIHVDPFVPAHTRKAVEGIIRSLPPTTHIGINLTGGTKLMFAGGLNACNESPNSEPFYFDIKQHNITFIKTGMTIPFKGVSTVDNFFVASGYDIVTPGYWQDKAVREARKDLTLKLWQKRNLLGNLYSNKDFRAYNQKFGKKEPPFNFSISHLNASFKNNKARLVFDDETLDFPDCDDFGSYLGGGWLEEYTYLLLKPLVEEGLIFDLRIGMEIAPPGQRPPKGQMPFGEFDCVFTDGKRLFIVECKSGNVKQEYIQKLENNLKNYGGIAARGILVSSFPLQPMLLTRISNSTSIKSLHPNQMSTNNLRQLLYN